MKHVPPGITRAIGRSVLQAKKNSPHIFFAAGLVGTVGATVLACRATLKVEKTMGDIHHELDYVKKTYKPEENSGDAAAEHLYYKHMLVAYGRSGVAVGRLYAPAVIVGSVSVIALTGSHVQLVRRNAALTSTLAMISKAYADYRMRIQDELGVDRERKIFLGLDGQNAENSKAIEGVPNNHSIYARFFDEYSPYWQRDIELNRIFLTCQQNYANNKLRSRGHVFLNEIYDSLGFERSSAGQVVGWIWNSDVGDNYIDFGMFEDHNAAAHRFANGLERSLLLDFNVDGVVYDKI